MEPSEAVRATSDPATAHTSRRLEPTAPGQAWLAVAGAAARGCPGAWCAAPPGTLPGAAPPPTLRRVVRGGPCARRAPPQDTRVTDQTPRFSPLCLSATCRGVADRTRERRDPSRAVTTESRRGGRRAARGGGGVSVVRAGGRVRGCVRRPGRSRGDDTHRRPHATLDSRLRRAPRSEAVSCDCHGRTATGADGRDELGGSGQRHALRVWSCCFKNKIVLARQTARHTVPSSVELTDPDRK